MPYNQTNKIYSQIKEKILNGEFKPSQSLIEMDLVKQFNSSRVTIKKALLMLKSENLIELPENKSARVRSFNIGEVIQFLDARILLEGYCATITAPVIDRDSLIAMEGFLEQMKMKYKASNIMEYSETNVRFHKCVYDACPNRVVVDMIWEIRNKISRYGFKTVLVPGRVDSSYIEHVNMLEAYKAHDAQRAYDSTVLHISNLKKTLNENYQLLFSL
ncbi:MAG: GntR family transcriptional regulator [Sphaerochaetaceae bacterium]